MEYAFQLHAVIPSLDNDSRLKKGPRKPGAYLCNWLFSFVCKKRGYSFSFQGFCLKFQQGLFMYKLQICSLIKRANLMLLCRFHTRTSGILQILFPGILRGISKVLDQRWLPEAGSPSLHSFINLTGSGPHLALPRWYNWGWLSALWKLKCANGSGRISQSLVDIGCSWEQFQMQITWPHSQRFSLPRSGLESAF